MLIKVLEPNFTFSDDRGVLTQLVRTGYNQINVVESKAGVFRGNHYHKDNNEVFFVVSGAFSLIVEKENIQETYLFSAGDMFLVPPFVIHSFDYVEDTILVAMYDKGVENEDGTKDIYSK